MDKSGVYKLHWRDCSGAYIGQTGRRLNIRIDELKKVILNNRSNSGLYNHCLRKGHFPDTQSVKLLNQERESKRLELEQLEIRKAIKRQENVLND